LQFVAASLVKIPVQYILNGWCPLTINTKAVRRPDVADDRDDDSGRFQTTYPTETFLAAVEHLDVPTTSNVADYVGCSYDLAYRRLNALAETGHVEKTDVGGSFMWNSA
jgi:hypothetical protein